MLRVAALSIVVATLSGCAYTNPTQPTPPPISDVAPAFLTLGVPAASNGLVTAYVQNAHGAPLSGIVVRFKSTVGDVSPSAAQTGADGRASATVTAPSDARVTATAGTLTANAIVPVSTTPTPTPTPTPSPGPAPTPPPPTPSVLLNVSASATTGVPLNFSVSSTATGQTWTWTFGDGETAQTTAFSTSHTYTVAGTYTATVSGVGTPSSSATITVSDPATPSPPASSAGLVISLTCTPATHGTATPCNASATYHGAPIFSTAITKVDWDWGDGSSLITLAPGAPVASHTYVQAGTYLIVPTVTATTVDGAKMGSTSKSVIIP